MLDNFQWTNLISMGIQYFKLDNFQGTFTFNHTFPFLTAAFHFLNSAFHDLVLSCLSEQCHFYFSLLIHFHFCFPWPSIARYIRTMPPRSTSTTLSLGQSGSSDLTSENLTQVTNLIPINLRNGSNDSEHICVKLRYMKDSHVCSECQKPLKNIAVSF